jgi:hypothetical protein
MRTATAILTAMLMCGCKENKKPDAPPKQFQPITGAFGFTLGQKMDASIEAIPTPGAAGVKGALIHTTKFPPFGIISVFALDDGRVYSVMGSLGDDIGTTQHWRGDEEREAIADLESKYGPPKETKHPGGSTWLQWDDGRAEIVLNSSGVSYSDKVLTPNEAEIEEYRKQHP